jgi:hypothetical protein
MSKRRKISDESGKEENNEDVSIVTSSNSSSSSSSSNQMDVDDEYPLFTTQEDVDKAREELTQRFEEGEKHLEAKCAELENLAITLEAKLKSSLRAHMFKLSSKDKNMKMRDFMREYDCSQLSFLLGQGVAPVAQDAPLGDHGTVRSPIGNNSNNVVPQTPMNQNTERSKCQAGMFTVSKNSNGEITVVLPNGEEVKSGGTVEEKEEKMKILKAMQDDLQALMDEFK